MDGNLSASGRPHSSWARFYDEANALSLGEYYDGLTKATVDQVRQTVEPPSRVLDLGAGTGRMSLPLASAGYSTLAVEPCQEMIRELRAKASRQGLPIEIFAGEIESFDSPEACDLALCIFTVISYILHEDSLHRSFAAVVKALRPRGFMLLEVPSQSLFHSHRHQDRRIDRNITIERCEGSIYRYHEATTIHHEHSSSSYEDEFFLRYWPLADVLALLQQLGLEMQEDISQSFPGPWTRHYLLRKE